MALIIPVVGAACLTSLAGYCPSRHQSRCRYSNRRSSPLPDLPSAKNVTSHVGNVWQNAAIGCIEVPVPRA
jgi:hypothetical protein